MNAQTKIDLTKAILLWNQSVTRKAIAEQFGVGEGAIKAFIQKHRVHFHPRESKNTRSTTWTPDDDEQLAELWERGLTALEIGKSWGGRDIRSWAVPISAVIFARRVDKGMDTGLRCLQRQDSALNGSSGKQRPSAKASKRERR